MRLSFQSKATDLVSKLYLAAESDSAGAGSCGGGMHLYGGVGAVSQWWPQAGGVGGSAVRGGVRGGPVYRLKSFIQKVHD